MAMMVWWSSLAPEPAAGLSRTSSHAVASRSCCSKRVSASPSQAFRRIRAWRLVNSPGSTRAPSRVRGVCRATFRHCRRGLPKRSEARRCTGQQRRRAIATGRSRHAAVTATSLAPRSSTGRSSMKSSRTTTSSPKDAWASRGATAYPVCRPPTTSRCCMPAPRSLGTSASIRIISPSIHVPGMGARSASSRAFAHKAARPGRNGARSTPRFRARKRLGTWTCASSAWRRK